MKPTLKILNSSANSIPSDVINLQDENTTIIFGSKTFDQPDDKSDYPLPFYITLTVHDHVIEVLYCPIDDQVVNIFTKSLIEVKFSKPRSMLGVQECVPKGGQALIPLSFS